MPQQQEVLTAARFYIELSLNGSPNPVDAVFMECSGFKRTQEVIEACEVTPQRWGSANASAGMVMRTKIPGNVKSNNLVLKRGLTCSTSLWKWFDEVQAGNWAQQRRDGSVTIYDQAAMPQARFQFVRAWPTRYSISDLSASSNEYELEELELACEEFFRDGDVEGVLNLEGGAAAERPTPPDLPNIREIIRERIENRQQQFQSRRAGG